ncbi:MAG TPA: DUF1800 family protein, partial [Chthoniobacterales bacterium]|nr:DUF1800 family protein [Chthoniobacterales bacterium]
MASMVGWWAQRMYSSPAPLVEKMTLFWHGHFATSAEKVNSYRMWLQNETLRGCTRLEILALWSKPSH